MIIVMIKGVPLITMTTSTTAITKDLQHLNEITIESQGSNPALIKKTTILI